MSNATFNEYSEKTKQEEDRSLRLGNRIFAIALVISSILVFCLLRYQFKDIPRDTFVEIAKITAQISGVLIGLSGVIIYYHQRRFESSISDIQNLFFKIREHISETELNPEQADEEMMLAESKWLSLPRHTRKTMLIHGISSILLFLTATLFALFSMISLRNDDISSSLMFLFSGSGTLAYGSFAATHMSSIMGDIMMTIEHNYLVLKEKSQKENSQSMQEMR